MTLLTSSKGRIIIIFLFTAALLLSARGPAGEAQSEKTRQQAVDNRIYVPPNYIDYRPLPMGATFTDAVFATSITRLSDGANHFGDSVHHEYAVMSPFNKDNTRILLLTGNHGFYVADRQGNVIVPPLETLRDPAEPRWSLTEAHIFYYREGNQLRKFDINLRQSSVVHTFSQFNIISFGGESDISDDGDHLIIVGNRRFVGVYTISTNQLGPLFDSEGLGEGFDLADLTHKNNVILRWNSDGLERYRGYELYDQNMRFIRQLTSDSAHGDRGLDEKGEEVLYMASYNDVFPPEGCENNGVLKIRLSDGQRTCLVGMNYVAEIHISSNGGPNNPWVLVSAVETAKGTANEQASLPPDWEQLWGVRYNEVVAVKNDGSEVRRLAHHRSRVIGDYWFTPRATISRDGKYAIYDSNYGIGPIVEYTDAFLIHLGDRPVVNTSAASYNPQEVAPDSIVAAFSDSLATVTVASSILPLPTALAGTRVKVKDSLGAERFAPLFFVSPTQVNYLLPPETAHGSTTVTVTSGQNVLREGVVLVNHVAPGLFTADASGKGLPVGVVVRIQADGAQIVEPIIRFDPATNRFVAVPIDFGPATDQMVLVLFGTGIRGRSEIAAVETSIGGFVAQPLYAGPQNAFAGLDQVNLLLSQSLRGKGNVTVAMQVNGHPVNPVEIVVR